jgi:hypothetical protein
LFQIRIVVIADFRRKLAIGDRQAFGSELFSEYSILFLEVLYDIALIAIDPTGEERQQRLKG